MAIRPAKGATDAVPQGTLHSYSQLTLGYVFNRLTLAIGVDFYNRKLSVSDSANDDETTSSVTGLLFQPTLEYRIVRLGPIYLSLTAGVHVGLALWNDSVAEEDDTTDNVLVGFHAGVVCRYYFHPRLAVGVMAGLRGIWSVTMYGYEGAGGAEKMTTSDGTVGLTGAALLTFLL